MFATLSDNTSKSFWVLLLIIPSHATKWIFFSDGGIVWFVNNTQNNYKGVLMGVIFLGQLLAPVSAKY